MDHRQASDDKREAVEISGEDSLGTRGHENSRRASSMGPWNAECFVHGFRKQPNLGDVRNQMSVGLLVTSKQVSRKARSIL